MEILPTISDLSANKNKNEKKNILKYLSETVTSISTQYEDAALLMTLMNLLSCIIRR